MILGYTTKYAEETLPPRLIQDTEYAYFYLIFALVTESSPLLISKYIKEIVDHTLSDPAMRMLADILSRFGYKEDALSLYIQISELDLGLVHAIYGILFQDEKYFPIFLEGLGLLEKDPLGVAQEMQDIVREYIVSLSKGEAVPIDIYRLYGDTYV